jgi:hypothetical protein
VRDWRTERHHGPERGSSGPTADCGAAACRALPGGSPTGAAPHAGQLARTRRPVAQAVTLPGDRAHVSDRAVLLAPGTLSPRTDHRQGRTSSLRCGRSTLTLIFPGKTSAPIGRKDRTRLVPLLPMSLTGRCWRSTLTVISARRQDLGIYAQGYWSGLHSSPCFVAFMKCSHL